MRCKTMKHSTLELQDVVRTAHAWLWPLDVNNEVQFYSSVSQLIGKLSAILRTDFIGTKVAEINSGRRWRGEAWCFVKQRKASLKSNQQSLVPPQTLFYVYFYSVCYLNPTTAKMLFTGQFSIVLSVELIYKVSNKFCLCEKFRIKHSMETRLMWAPQIFCHWPQCLKHLPPITSYCDHLPSC